MAAHLDEVARRGGRGYGLPLEVLWGAGEERLDPVTGEIVPRPETRATEGGGFFVHAHYGLRYVGEGLTVVGIFTMLMFAALITGLIVHKRIFKDFFTFRPNKGTRSWLDAHHVFGLMVLPFLLMIVYSGLALNLGGYMPAPEVVIPDEEKPREFPSPVTRPAVPMAEVVARAEAILGKGEIGGISIGREGEKLQIDVSRYWGTQYPIADRENSLQFDGETGERLPPENFTFGQAPAWKALWYLAGLHYAWFAGMNLRWLYFISGLVGCAVIATGLILWTTRRRARHERGAAETGRPAFGFQLVEKLNIATIAALPIAVAAYFWANRLLSFTMAERAEWEVHTLFLLWGWLAYYALLRPARRAWVELFALAAAAFAFLPVLNAFTTDKHLAATITHGDWALAGVDLTFLAFGAGFGGIAWVLRRR
ncbi:MAG: PepSY domain-containing protein [Zoogloeaceae bacterium]|nr:PepSY domain-containing protein [Zoogloeaceae bacterium]